MIALTNSNGWKHLYWTVSGAMILGVLTAGVAGWRQFTVVQERQEYLMRLNDQQNTLFETIKDSLRALQEQNALQGQIDGVLREKLQEHDLFIREILGRLRQVEQRRE